MRSANEAELETIKREFKPYEVASESRRMGVDREILLHDPLAKQSHSPAVLSGERSNVRHRAPAEVSV